MDDDACWRFDWCHEGAWRAAVRGLSPGVMRAMAWMFPMQKNLRVLGELITSFGEENPTPIANDFRYY